MDQNQNLSDPLTRVTRSKRRYLLVASMIGYFIAETGLMPRKIHALGMEFAKADQRIFLRMISLVIVYYLATFLIYAISDIAEWRKNSIARELQALKELGSRVYKTDQFSGFRLCFDILVPIGVSLYTLIIIIFRFSDNYEY